MTDLSTRAMRLGGSLLLASLAAGCGTTSNTAAVSAFEAGAVSGRALDRRAASETLAAVRRATERFRDVAVAVKEGYVRDPANMCITPPMEGLPRQLGGMGVHYFRPDLLGIARTSPRVGGTGVHTDFTKPGILIYEPQADGSLALVAVENLVFADAWRAAGHTELPEFEGQQYYAMTDNPNTAADEAHGFEPHYELHMWLYRDNPAGMFMQFNTRVTCDHHTAGSHSGH